MELKGSRTEKNLEAAFAGESRARNAYLYYAQAARSTGHPDVADVFEAIAQNEGEHAEAQFQFLGKIGDTVANLKAAAADEHLEQSTLYPQFVQTAREEGFAEIADFFDRMRRVEARHEGICRQLLKALAENVPARERTVGHSAVSMAQWTLPQQANPAGFVHGGELMKSMDNAAAVVAARHARTNVVTARVEDINFIRPVRVGDLVVVSGAITFVSRSSMEVRVEVETENLLTGEKERALTAYYVMVALDAEGKASEVPPLLVTTEAEQKLFEEGRLRYEAHKKKVATTSR